MSRYIDADRIDWRLIIPTNITLAEENTIHNAKRLIERQQTADVRENIHAHWIVDFAWNGWMDWTCSNCGYRKNIDVHVSLDYNFCPKCGAKIDKGGDAK